MQQGTRRLNDLAELRAIVEEIRALQKPLI